LNDWEIDAASIRRDGDRPVDALDLIAGFHQQLGIGAEMLPVYLEEQPADGGPDGHRRGRCSSWARWTTRSSRKRPVRQQLADQRAVRRS
jgi:hypothetical protein